jgi:hypothetical protein
MAFFGLSDITISKEDNRRGPLAPLFTTGRFGGTGNTFRYPIDIGNYDKAHYMIINILRQKNTQYEGLGVQQNNVNQIGNFKPSTPGQQSTSFASKINGAIDNAINNFTSGKTLFGKNISTSFGGPTKQRAAVDVDQNTYIDKVKDIENQSLIKTTVETDDTIVLYMPDTLQYTFAQSYSEAALGDEMGGKIAAAGKSILEDLQNGLDPKAAAEKGLKGPAATAAIQKGFEVAGSKVIGQNSAKAAAFLTLGGVNNPMLEMLYSSPAFRQFTFEFMFYPRDEREALEVQNILERLRFHQAPEIDGGSGGLLLIPPSEFELSFYYGGRPNPNLPGIGRCVLTNISVNYAPNGWSAYEMFGENDPRLGRTGMPTAIQLTLEFKETVILTKASMIRGNGGYKGSQSVGDKIQNLTSTMFGGKK